MSTCSTRVAAKCLAVTWACALPWAAQALQCPEMPKQASRDAEVEVRVGVRLLGDAKGPELEARARQLTTDLMGRLPRADRVYLEQMLFAAYCSAVRDNAALTEGEREARVLAYRREMQKALGDGAVPAAVDPRDKARAELARLPVPYTGAAFHRAIRDGDLKVVRLFIAAGMDLEVRNPDTWRPLQAAVFHEQWAVVDALIDAGAAPAGGALAQLGARGDLARVKRLLARRPAKEEIDAAWVLAASYAQTEAAQLMRERGADPVRLGPQAVLRVAVRNGEDAESLRALEVLAAQGVPIDQADDDGWTPLMQAVTRGKPRVVATLLRLGADPNKVCPCSGYGDGLMTPLLLASMQDADDVIAPLLDAGARPDATNARGRSALHLMLDKGTRTPAPVLLLLDRGVPVDTPDADGVTPLMHAAENAQAPVVRALLDRGARPAAHTPAGRTPLAFAAVRDRDDNATLLIDAGAPVDARTQDGRTVLAYAVRRYATDTVRLLLQRGARPDLPDRDGLTPLDHARALTDGDARRAIIRLLENAAR
ncbi:ankyrin repeat domain-containing protein [Leptothrix sp. BB-4]